MSAAVLEATWSDFLRDPNSVTGQLERADVVLHRRDAEDVYLSSESRHEATYEAVNVLSRLLAALVANPEIRSELRRVDVTPWQRFLSKKDRAQFLTELVETAAASADLGTLTPLAQLVAEWRNTALVRADPALAAALLQSHPGDDGVVARPAE